MENLLQQKRSVNKKPSPLHQRGSQVICEKLSASRFNPGDEEQIKEDTFSCTSCALKQCATADPSKLVLFITVVLGLVLVGVVLDGLCSQSITVKNNLDEEKRDRRSDDTVGEGRKVWEASKSKLMSGLSDLLGQGNRDSSMHDMNMDQYGNSMPELSSILDPVKVNEAYSSNSLRSFYKKLLKTDVQIRNLKKGFAALKRGNGNDFFEPVPPRAKRSLVPMETTRPQETNCHKRSLRKFHIVYPPITWRNGVKEVYDVVFDIKEDSDMDSLQKNTKEQKLHKHSTTPKNNVEIMQYAPSQNYKTAGDQRELKHPYNKNSEKLEEMLSRMLDVQPPELPPNIENMINNDYGSGFKSTAKVKLIPMKTAKEEGRGEETSEPLMITKLMKSEPKSKENNKPSYQLIDKTRYNEYKDITTNAMKVIDDKNDNSEFQMTEPNMPDSSNDNFDYMITLVTVVGPPSNKFRKEPTDQKLYFPKLRRLLQDTKHYDENDDDDPDDEAEDYEDQRKEHWDREKRTVNPTELELERMPTSASTTEMPGMRNPNWKGPMPLYHDELNYMINAAMKIAKNKGNKHKVKVNEDNKVFDETNAKENYDELVEMAQAYSDYGVLDGKKEAVEKNKVPVNALSLDSRKRNEILERIKNRVDKPRHWFGQQVKLKSKGELIAETDKLFKKLGLHKRFTKDRFLEAKRNIINAVKFPSAISSVPLERSASYRVHAETIQDTINAQPKLHIQKERSIYTGHRRSLKSIETDEYNDDVNSKNETKLNDEEKYETTTNCHLKSSSNYVDMENKSGHLKSNVFNGTINTLNVTTHLNKSVPMLSTRNDSLNNNNSNMSLGLGNIFGMIADYCLFLAGFDKEQEKNHFRSLNDIIAMLRPSDLQIKNKSTTNKLNNDTRAPITALFDSDMMENSRYRSRVLLAFEDQIDNVTSRNDQEKEESSKSFTVANIEKIDISIKNNTKKSSYTDKTNESIENENVTVVKRCANGDSLTWNDLYDDEYGVRDKLDNDMQEKAMEKSNELLSKSENWFGAKFKEIANTLKKTRRHWRQNKNLHSDDKSKVVRKRSNPVSNKEHVSSKQTFETLTANMKKVIHDAAEAIHDTANREARSDNEQASTMMQQLVSLMSELVDIQVRQKTCVQLPEDLRSFLTWLTAPAPPERNEFSLPLDPTYDSGSTTKNFLNTDTFDLMSPNTRNDCLGTIHDVEDLIQQYDEMSEEDKSKMSGVREYLEHQLDFLHKQLADFNEFGYPVMYQERTIRRRRQLSKQQKDIRLQRKANRFLKYFGRKRTKSTVFNEDVIVTEDYNTLKRKNEKNKKDRKKDHHRKPHEKVEIKNGPFANVNKVEGKGNVRVGNEKVSNENAKKRNLQDVYYSPLGRTNSTTVKYRN